MASSSGLQRRRVANNTSADVSSSSLSNGTTSSISNSASQRAASTPSSPSSSTKPLTSTTTHGGSAFEGGTKIAFDPRDVEREKEEDRRSQGKVPKLTIMEEVLLLGLKDKQGYLSFWNDNISYALRGCILIELALRRRIALVKDPNRRRNTLPERLVEVIDERTTGETILDETLKMMKAQQQQPPSTSSSSTQGAGSVSDARMSVNSWIDLLSGETWNVLKIGFQLKQVRERLAKGLVDKGVLRTEKRNFLLFDMATHPVADVRTKEAIVTRVVTLLTTSTASVPEKALHPEGTQCRVTRTVALVCAAYAASVLDNAFGRLAYEEREAAFQRCDDILAEFAVWPIGSGSNGSNGGLPGSSSAAARRRDGLGGRIGAGGEITGRESVLGLVGAARKEMLVGEEDLGFELVAAVLEVLSKLDSLL